MSSKLSDFALGSPSRLVGILNLTPDSFSDGGRFNTVETARKQTESLLEAGAAMLDIGAESTRPGSEELSTASEMERLLPVLEALQDLPVPYSVDTYRAETAAAALQAGASLINDITGLAGGPELAEVVADSGAGLILMFNPSILRPDHPASQNFRRFAPREHFSEAVRARAETLPILEQMQLYFEESLSLARRAGISEELIWLDPGIGFGLSLNENLELLNGAAELIRSLGFARYFGVSRKRSLATILGSAGLELPREAPAANDLSAPLDPRDAATAAVTAILAAQGVELLRVHNVAANRPALAIGQALAAERAGLSPDQILSPYQH